MTLGAPVLGFAARSARNRQVSSWFFESVRERSNVGSHSYPLRAEVPCPTTWNTPGIDALRRLHREAGGGMSKVSEYRQHAKECRGLAKRSRSLEHREMLLNIAATWESLANDRIKTAEGLERIANLEKAARKSRKHS
jgi:hypothetical protein